MQDDRQGGKATFLIMECIEGVSLQQAFDDRLEMDGGDVVAIFLDQLAILDHLHGRVPPILRRDIKPANIISGRTISPRSSISGPCDTCSGTGRVRLDHRGNVRLHPYEQYMGQATPASDLLCARRDVPASAHRPSTA